MFNTIMENPSITLHPLNSSHIVIIPKKADAVLSSEFRPISVLHSIQRIFSKIMATKTSITHGEPSATHLN
jgi:hypothetical protein